MYVSVSVRLFLAVHIFPRSLGVICYRWVLSESHKSYFKACVLYFLSNFYFHQMVTLQKPWKMFFVSLKKFFSFSRYSSFCNSVFPLFLPVNHCFRSWFKINLKVYDIINCLNKNLITHFVWYLEKEKRYDIETLSIDRVLNKEHFYGKIMQKMCTKS